jgi:hypothetical protein
LLGRDDSVKHKPKVKDLTTQVQKQDMPEKEATTTEQYLVKCQERIQIRCPEVWKEHLPRWFQQAALRLEACTKTETI